MMSSKGTDAPCPHCGTTSAIHPNDAKGCAEYENGPTETLLEPHRTEWKNECCADQGNRFTVDFRLTVDLAAIPDAQLQSEVQRRRNAMRKSHKGGRPRKHAPDCAQCGQPMLPVGVKKEINQYDHASGCPLGGRPRKEGGVGRAE